MADSNRFSWIMWPFDALWWLVTTILALTGRLIMVLLGAVLMLGGVPYQYDDCRSCHRHPAALLWGPGCVARVVLILSDSQGLDRFFQFVAGSL